LYRAQPIGMIGISSFAPMFSFLMLMIPLVGQSLALLLFPFVIAALLDTAKATATTGRPGLDAYLDAWRRPTVRLRLLQLGVIYALVVGLISLVVPNGAGAPSGGNEANVAATSNATWWAALVVAAISVPLQVLMLFATSFISRFQQPMAKAMFFSVFAFWRNLGAVVVNLLSVAALLCLGLMALGALVELLGLSEAAVQMLALPVLFALLPIGVGSSYAMVSNVIREAAPEHP
jgi:hypothetical protein